MGHPKKRQSLGACCGALVVLTAVLFGSNAEAAVVCARPAEQPALNARVLQAHLMVAALSCNERARYNSFVKKFQGELVARGRAVTAMFDRAYGRNASTQINRFVTALANDASSRSLASGQFCSDAAFLFETLDKIEPSMLSELAENQPFSEAHGVVPCHQQASAANDR